MAQLLFHGPVRGIPYLPDGVQHHLHSAYLLIQKVVGEDDPLLLRVALVDEPDNPHDRNAMRLEEPNLGMVGYVPMESTQSLRGSISAAGCPKAYVIPHNAAVSTLCVIDASPEIPTQITCTESSAPC